MKDLSIRANIFVIIGMLALIVVIAAPPMYFSARGESDAKSILTNAGFENPHNVGRGDYLVDVGKCRLEVNVDNEDKSFLYKDVYVTPVSMKEDAKFLGITRCFTPRG